MSAETVNNSAVQADITAAAATLVDAREENIAAATEVVDNLPPPAVKAAQPSEEERVPAHNETVQSLAQQHSKKK